MSPTARMQDTETINGENLVRLFRELHRNKTVIKINLLGEDYERLTMVTGILSKRPPYHFRIDYPSGFEEAVRGITTWKIRFEFNGKDRLIYRFKTSGGYISGKDIFIPFPPQIERVQRRRYFRQEPPLGTRMIVPRFNKKYELTLFNVSEGGALVGMGKGSPRQPIFKKGEYLRHIVLLFPSQEQQFRITIKEALVKRLDKDPLTLRYRYALQFTDMGKEEMKDLRDLIYIFQRDFLKKRQKVEG